MTGYRIRVVCTDRGQHGDVLLGGWLEDHETADGQGKWDVPGKANLIYEPPTGNSRTGRQKTMQGNVFSEKFALANPRTGPFRIVNGGKTYLFECPRCKTNLKRSPEWFDGVCQKLAAAGVSRLDISSQALR